MSLSKRKFDICVALCLVVVLSPVLLGIAILIWYRDGTPVFYISERMKTPQDSFQLVKFRTMAPSADDSGVSGGDKSARVTRTGAMIRKNRIDELPQLWNILKGDLSFVGPRPPLRQYTDMFPELYGQVLKSRPGVTGLASLVYHQHEEMLLADCKTVEETNAVYCRACIPRKAHLDLIYQAHRSLCMDMEIMLKTAFKSLR